MNILTATADGSNTLYNEEIGEHYHSANGALQESRHVFIEAGLRHVFSLLSKGQNHASGNENNIHLLEVGFGTGLNFLLSMNEAENAGIKLHYTGIEAYPLSTELLSATGYGEYIPQALWEKSLALYAACLRERQAITTMVDLRILPQKLEDTLLSTSFDLVYYDAFSVGNQAEMWTEERLEQVCNALKPGGIFVTYAITGNLKRALKKQGMHIEKLPGAPGKREMLRAIKIDRTTDLNI